MSATRRAATLPVSFFERSADVVARDLLGMTVVSTLDGARTAGRIVEAEAYLGYDRSRLARLSPPPARAERGALRAPGHLVRLPVVRHALVRQPGVRCARGRRAPSCCARWSRSRGSALMRERRGGVADRQLCSGPGKLCQALGITRDLDGSLMRRSGALVRSHDGAGPPAAVVTPADRHHQGGGLAASVPGGRVALGVSRRFSGRPDGLRRPV